MPAGKLQLYHIVPNNKEPRGQAGPHVDSQQPTLLPTPAPVPSVPAVTQVSLGQAWVLASPQPPSLGLELALPVWGELPSCEVGVLNNGHIKCPGQGETQKKGPLTPAT